jgi:hypothetical protein
LFVQAEIVGRTVEQVYEIPRTALRGESQVLVVKPQMMADTNSAAGGEGVLEIRTVPVVRAAREQALVRGLEPGELVCLSALDAPVNGMRVRLAVEKTAVAPQSRP